MAKFWSRVAIQLLCAGDVYVNALSVRVDGDDSSGGQDDATEVYGLSITNLLEQMNERNIQEFISQTTRGSASDFLQPIVFQDHASHELEWQETTVYQSSSSSASMKFFQQALFNVSRQNSRIPAGDANEQLLKKKILKENFRVLRETKI